MSGVRNSPWNELVILLEVRDDGSEVPVEALGVTFVGGPWQAERAPQSARQLTEAQGMHIRAVRYTQREVLADCEPTAQAVAERKRQEEKDNGRFADALIKLGEALKKPQPKPEGGLQ